MITMEEENRSPGRYEVDILKKVETEKHFFDELTALGVFNKERGESCGTAL